MDQKKRLQKAYMAGSVLKSTKPEAIKEKHEKNIIIEIDNNLNNNRVNKETALRGFLKVGGPGGYRKAAKFLLLLGKREAATVLKHFSTKEIEEIAREIASIKQINNQEAAKILNEFGSSRGRRSAPSTGGLEVARNMLTAAFGDEKGQAIFKKVIPFNGEKPFSFLEDLEYQQLIMILRKEPVHVLTVILSFLDANRSSKILESLPPEDQTAIVTRMASMKKVSPEVIMSMEEVLIERIRTQGKVVTEEVDGQSVLAEILKNMALADEGRILDTLSDTDRGLAEAVREKLFTVDTINFINDADMEKILRDFDDAEIAVLLKGQGPELRNKIIYNVSKRRIEFIYYEEEAIGAMRKSD
ncbi:MAG: flagellar motor switch protein FliG, partial [Spirochaetaceae bacterium]|nr:flagellar motor switch protein FliG [Spirochaetaceae bacterium]